MVGLNSLFLCFYFVINLYVKVRVEQKMNYKSRKQKTNFEGIDITDIFNAIKKEFIQYTPSLKAFDYLTSKEKYKEIILIKKLLKFRDEVNNYFPILATLLVIANIINIIIWAISKIT